VVVSFISGRMHHQINRLTKAERDVAAREATLRLVHDELERRTAELERRTAELESFILHAPIGFGLLDRDKRYVRVNDALAQMNGISAEEHVGRSFADVIPKHLVPQVDGVLQHCLDTGETLQDMDCTSELPTHPPTRRNLLVTIFPVRDSNGIVAIGCITLDITERKRAEESERFARAEAERLNRLKDEFVATISHELKTPLTAILGWAQVLQRPARENDKIDRGLEVIERNARVLTQLVSDLLDISRIANGKLSLETLPVDLGAVTRRTLETVRHIADAKSVHLDAHIAQIHEPLLGDATRIQQIVWNLLSNAIKFTPRGGAVEVRVEARNERAAIIVRDTGQGIAPDFLPHIFERFRQEDSSFSRKHGGLGLGLTIVKHLSELHGGRVIAESDGIGRGATFTVELPLDSRPPLRAGF
jgi:PAS domain S-box-containing protein